MQAQHTASAAVKLSQFSWENEFLRKQQSCAVLLRRTGSGEIEDLLAVRTEHGEHGVCRLLLLRLLGVAVGTLQKTGVRMTYEVCHRLLVHAAVQKRAHKVVPQGVQVVLPRKADGFIDLPQPLGEGVRVDELTVFIGEEIGTEPAALLVRLHLLAAFVGEEDAPQVRGEADFTALAVFGAALHDALAGNAAAGAADGEQQTVLCAGEVRPLQSAQLAPAAAGVHGEQIKQTVVPRLLCQRVQQLFVGMRCTVRCGVGRSNIRAGFFSMISLRLASLSTAETTERYRCAVDSLMRFPWCLRLRSSESIFSSAIGRSLLRRMPPIMG